MQKLEMKAAFKTGKRIYRKEKQVQENVLMKVGGGNKEGRKERKRKEEK